MKTSLTIIATTTKSYNVLTAINQILLGYNKTPLVLQYFPYGYDIDLSIENLNKCFKKLNDYKKNSLYNKKGEFIESKNSTKNILLKKGVTIDSKDKKGNGIMLYKNGIELGYYSADAAHEKFINNGSSKL